MDEGMDAPQGHDTVSAATERLARAAHEGIDRAAQRSERAERYVREIGQRAGERSRDAVHRMTEYLQDHPYGSVGIALAAGVIVGAWLSRR